MQGVVCALQVDVSQRHSEILGGDMTVKFFGCEIEVGGPYLTTDLRDSNDIAHDGEKLRGAYAAGRLSPDPEVT